MRLVIKAEAAEAEALARLQEEFPGHRIWRSVRSDDRLGDWVATLRDPDEGVDATVMAGSAAKLRDALVNEKARVGLPNPLRL